MQKYLELLKKQAEARESIQTPIVFLSDTVFGFTTYNSRISAILCGKMVGAIRAILSDNLPQYIEDNIIDFTTMINMPFLDDRIDWGTSLNSVHFDINHGRTEFYEIGLIIEKMELNEFMRAVVEFYDLIISEYA